MFKLNKYLLISILLFSLVLLPGCITKNSEPQQMKGYIDKTFHSDKYGFTIEFPDTWLGNFSLVEEDQNNIHALSFVYNQLPGKEYPIFRLYIFPFDTWQIYKNSQNLILNQQEFAYTKDYVYVLTRTLDNPYSSPQLEQFASLVGETGKVVGSFILDDGKKYSPDKFKVFFNNTKLNPDMLDCRLTYPVLRNVSGTMPYAEQSLRALFAGPTDDEKNAGFQSLFNTSTARVLRSVKIVENVALVNLKDIRTLIPNANSSCGSAQFIAEIEKTLKELPDVYQVYMAIDEDPSRIYEWLQLGCSEQNFYCDKTPFKPVQVEIDGAKIETPTSLDATTTMPEEKIVTTTKASTTTKKK